MCSAVSWFNFLANECVAVLEAFGLNLGISSSVPWHLFGVWDVSLALFSV